MLRLVRRFLYRRKIQRMETNQAEQEFCESVKRNGRVSVKDFCHFIQNNRHLFHCLCSNKPVGRGAGAHELTLYRSRHIAVQVENPTNIFMGGGFIYFFIGGQEFQTIDDVRILRTIREGKDPGPQGTSIFPSLPNLYKDDNEFLERMYRNK